MTDRGASKGFGEGVLIFAVVRLDPVFVVFLVSLAVSLSNRLLSFSASFCCLIAFACSAFCLFDSAACSAFCCLIAFACVSLCSFSNRLRSFSAA
jgi:hypothetical protein